MIDNKNVNTNKNQGEIVIYQTDNADIIARYGKFADTKADNR